MFCYIIHYDLGSTAHTIRPRFKNFIVSICFIFTNWENKGCTMVCVGSPEGPFPIWFKIIFYLFISFFYNWENKGCTMVEQGSWEDHPKKYSKQSWGGAHQGATLTICFNIFTYTEKEGCAQKVYIFFFLFFFKQLVKQRLCNVGGGAPGGQTPNLKKYFYKFLFNN